MATISSFELNMDSNVKNADTIRNIVLEQLKNDGAISNDVYEEYSTSWNIVIVKGAWYQKWFDKNKLNSDGYYYKFVKFN